MGFIYNDKEYINIVNDILEDSEFRKIDGLVHHGLSRLDHSLKVSYFSYKVAKLLRLDVRKTARAGLLHDFFLSDNENMKDKITSLFAHSSKAVKNADERFILSDKEKDIIISHMFPIASPKPPKYMEGWVVSTVDKVVGTYEFAYTYSYGFKLKFRNASVLIALFVSQFIHV